jgi:AraC-like DNA-binding protein
MLPDMVLPQRFALPFGNGAAVAQTSFLDYRDNITAIMAGLDDLSVFRGRQAPFVTRSVKVQINDLTLTASANTPLRFRMKESSATTLTIPFAGEIRPTLDKQQVVLQPGRAGVFLVGDALYGETDTRAALMLRLTPERILRTAAAMLGSAEDAARHVHLKHSRPIALQHGAVSFDVVFRQYCQIIDQFQQQPAALEALMLDDAIYRTVVMMLAPNAFFKAAPDQPSGKHGHLLKDLCEHIRANLAHPIGLTDMELFTRLSARTLARVFQEKLGCSPMAWVQEQRLLLVQQALQRAQAHETVTSIAVGCGFTRMGAFGALYARRFGERPSQTLKRATSS